MASTSEAAAEQEMRAAFAAFDKDKSGTITLEELAVILLRPVAVEGARAQQGLPLAHDLVEAAGAHGREVPAHLLRLLVN